MIEIITIGTELLLGSTADSNGAWLGEQLSAEGIRVTRRTSVADDAEQIRDALTSALRRTRLVICTGGLGPTPDDLTRPVVASVYGRALHLDESWLAEIEQRWQRRGLPMPPLNRVQAEVQDGAHVLPNERGTAPGLIVEDDDLGITILLPGVPAEMRWLVQTHALPFLRARLPPLTPIRSRVVRTTGIAESSIAELLIGIEAQITPLTLAWLPTGIGEDVRVTCWGELLGSAAEEALDAAAREIAIRLQPWVYGEGQEDLAAIVGSELRSRSFTLAVAESCTGGMLAERITLIPGSSAYFLGAIVSYTDQAKQTVLGVSAETLAEHGAVSEAASLSMARGARAVLGADCAVSITGIAGPGGGTPEKPVGTVWIACALGEDVRAQRFRFTGVRNEIRARAAQAGLAMLLRRLRE